MLAKLIHPDHPNFLQKIWDWGWTHIGAELLDELAEHVKEVVRHEAWVLWEFVSDSHCGNHAAGDRAVTYHG